MNRKPSAVILLALLVLMVNGGLHSQQIDTTVQNHLLQLRRLYRDDVFTGKRYVTDYMLNRIIREMQNKISGVLIKEGRTIGTTASVEDKSFTINHTLTAAGSLISLQATASGTSEDNFLDIFSEGKYKRTITGGLNFNIFLPYNSGRYFLSDKWRLWSSLYLHDSCYNRNRSDIIRKKDSALQELQDIFDSCSTLLCRTRNIAVIATHHVNESIHISCDTCSTERLQYFSAILQSLSEYFPNGFDVNSCTDVEQFLGWVRTNRNNLASYMSDKGELSILDTIQKNAPWTRFSYKWLSGSIKMNQKIQPLFDPSASDKLYTTNYHDVFASASLSYKFYVLQCAQKEHTLSLANC